MMQLITLVLRIGVAVAFIYAGVLKALDPLAFADSIVSFGIVPVWLVNVSALSLPIFEVLLGLLLLSKRSMRSAALGILLLCILFAVAIGSAWARGLQIDCGCFGRSTRFSSPAWMLARDALLGVASGFIYWRAIRVTVRAETQKSV